MKRVVSRRTGKRITTFRSRNTLITLFERIKTREAGIQPPPPEIKFFISPPPRQPNTQYRWTADGIWTADGVWMA